MGHIKKMNTNFCNNCGKQGHNYTQCKIPITSYGVIAFRFNPILGENEYLMVCRKNSFGFIDFMRGKYSIYNKQYICNMVKQMTTQEKMDLKTMNFDDLWRKLWNIPSHISVNHICNYSNKEDLYLRNGNFKNEEMTSKDKFNMLKIGIFTPSSSSSYSSSSKSNPFSRFYGNNRISSPIFVPETNNYSIRNIGDYYSISSIIDECEIYEKWEEPEWGFPKGRRNYQEKDYEASLREFTEETGYDSKLLRNIQNIIPFEENIIGSNYKSYKHKYYLMYISYTDSIENNNLNDLNRLNELKNTEISKVEWKTYDECLHCIRSYNAEKKRLIVNIHNCLTKYSLYV